MRLRMGAPVRGARQRSWKRRLLLRGKEVQDERSDDAIERGASHGGELPVGEKYQTMERQRQRTFRHRLDPQPVSFVRSLEATRASITEISPSSWWLSEGPSRSNNMAALSSRPAHFSRTSSSRSACTTWPRACTPVSVRPAQVSVTSCPAIELKVSARLPPTVRWPGCAANP